MRRTGANGILHTLIVLVLAVGGLLPTVARSADFELADPSNNEALLERKLILLDRLVNQSSSMKRIEQSSNAQAKGLLHSARAAYEDAQRLMGENSLDKSGQASDEGLRAISKAALFVVDIRQQEERHRREYAQLRDRVIGFLESFDTAVTERDANALMPDRAEVDALIAGAQSNHESGRYREAGEQLSRAAPKIELALSKARDKETVVHQLVFDSLEDEYAYEVRRNDSYEMLIKLMIMEDAVVSSAHSYIQKKVGDNNQHKADAEVLAKKGDLEGALNVIEGSTEQLVKALRLGGAGI